MLLLLSIKSSETLLEDRLFVTTVHVGISVLIYVLIQKLWGAGTKLHVSSSLYFDSLVAACGSPPMLFFISTSGVGLELPIKLCHYRKTIAYEYCIDVTYDITVCCNF